MPIKLFDYQLDALSNMKNGCVLCGGVGSGKSLTALSYYYQSEGGALSSLMGEPFVPLHDPPSDLYIITTARKRDTFEWQKEMHPFLLTDGTEGRFYHHKVIVDSWNNVAKYKDVRNAFFIFDEQRVVGSGKWVKAFLRIAKANRWILLSATPGDTWSDYIPVFIANGFYRNRSEFLREHAVYAKYVQFPKIERFTGTGRLESYRRSILVQMDFRRQTRSEHIDLYCDYDQMQYKHILRTRFDPWKGEPFINAGALCYGLRRVVNCDESRARTVAETQESHPRLIIFYNFDYELEILKSIQYLSGTVVAEWNGHCHDPLPNDERWVYLVQYSAGAEGWNCITTDTILFYSQNYSYKVMIQAAGRTDRLNTPYERLFYYHLKSHASIDLAIAKTLKEKKNFNEGKFIKW